MHQGKSVDKGIEKSLFLLSVLSFFSALVDSFDFVDSFGSWFLGERAVKGIQLICIVLIIGILCNVFWSLIRSKK